MKLIVISATSIFDGEIDSVIKLFEAGLETFHLRKPKISTNQMKNFIKQIPHQYHNRIIIHSHHNLARVFNLKGIHITKNHRDKKLKTWLMVKYLKYINKNILITTSHKRLASLYEGEYPYDYVFLSPIFDNLTSKYQPGFTDHSLKSAIAKTPFKVIARGGIDEQVVEKVRDLGFAGMAMYSSIWKRPDPVAQFNKVIKKCEELNIVIE